MSCCSQKREIQSNSCRVYRFIRMLPRQALVLFFKGYRYVISPLFPPACRYTPTCSQYAIEAVSRYGVIRGTCKAVWRILRCHPFSRGGYDPVK